MRARSTGGSDWITRDSWSDLLHLLRLRSTAPLWYKGSGSAVEVLDWRRQMQWRWKKNEDAPIFLFLGVVRRKHAGGDAEWNGVERRTIGVGVGRRCVHRGWIPARPVRSGVVGGESITSRRHNWSVEFGKWMLRSLRWQCDWRQSRAPQPSHSFTRYPRASVR